MKILLAAPQPFYRERGTPIAVRLLAETLCEFGHEVDLLVYHDGEDIEARGLQLFRAARPPGVREVPIGISVQKLACDVPFVVKLAALMMRKRYDVIHAVEEAVFAAAVLNLRGRSKIVYDMDSSLSEQLTDKWTLLRPLGDAVPTPRAQRRAPLRGGVARLRGPGRQGSAMDGPPTGDRAAGRARRRIPRRHCGRVAAPRSSEARARSASTWEISSTTRALTFCSTRCPWCRQTAA